jgi:hypothetical protein
MRNAPEGDLGRRRCWEHVRTLRLNRTPKLPLQLLVVKPVDIDAKSSRHLPRFHTLLFSVFLYRSTAVSFWKRATSPLGQPDPLSFRHLFNFLLVHVVYQVEESFLQGNFEELDLGCEP